uniref:Formimidoylglutamate deiminase n=1 Tax=OCS116 cluster bacterium TaxID=2030921 RepID=A0A2A4Z0Q5_9PROT
MKIFAKQAWLANGWFDNVRLSIKSGKISQIERDVVMQKGDISVDTLLPALANLHSHTFQRAMAGMTEQKVANKDSFWTWRTLMYQFLEHISPEQYEAIAALTFMEMQEAGYASVGEFHYVHHQQNGVRYDNVAELSNRIMAATAKTGIGLTHLPVLYTYGGAKRLELSGGQLRFGNDVEQFAKLVEQAKLGLKQLPDDANIGIAPHSLRATCPDDLTEILKLDKCSPIHIHIAEQPKEVRDIKAWLGARPVEWLLDNYDVNSNWCLIHATHMTEPETLNVAKSGATIGLCPITEANLGDGVFNGAAYLKAGGSFGIGSDSNIRISLTEELRTLEYSQRLRDLNRNILADKDGSVGRSLYENAAIGGAKALNRNAGKIEIGYLADLISIDSDDVQLLGLQQSQIFDGLCFAADDRVVKNVWSAGRHMVKDGRHILKDEINQNYAMAMQSLMAKINA